MCEIEEPSALLGTAMPVPAPGQLQPALRV